MLIPRVLRSRSLAHRVVAMVIAGMLCLSGALLVFQWLALNHYAEELALDRQESNMRVAWRVLHNLGADFSSKDGTLFAGAQPLNGYFPAVDEIKALVGGTATIFMGDKRVSTNVMKPDGTRAIGTTLKAGPVYDRVLTAGLPFRGEAEILGQAYFTAYDPIKNAQNQVIGILYVGVPKSEFFAAVNSMHWRNALLTVLVTILLVVACMYTARKMFQPLDTLRAAADRMSNGDLDAAVPAFSHEDDIGRLATALSALRKAGREKARIERAADEQRRIREDEQRQQSEARLAAIEAQRRVVNSLAMGLEALSGGDLSVQVDTPFAAEYEKLRADFNAAISSLADTINNIRESADGMLALTESMNFDAGELSKTTQHQTNRLQDTVTSLGEVAAKVRETALAAEATRTSVEAAHQEAEKSGAVVHKAIAAMGQIESSSRQIQQIIGVIDEIAFQTNLLALNAAVEAARAGAEGRGFAVVAAEVRNLASRSSQAAKQIKELILQSGEHVTRGTQLVGETGNALRRIVDQVGALNSMVGRITATEAEQADKVQRVNQELAELGQAAQQNSSIVEQSALSCRSLAHDALTLVERVGRFRVARSPRIQRQVEDESA
jgi:methyl-accepting chemotaxis protein